MDDADRPMSQADIDAMLAAAQGSAGPAPAVQAPSGTAAPGPGAGATPSPSPFRATFGGDDDSASSGLAERLAKVEAALERLGQIEQTVADMGAVAEQVRKLSAELSTITEYLQGTIGYGARQSFQCGSCGSQGLVGTRISCTHCGQETWWGWFPQR